MALVPLAGFGASSALAKGSADTYSGPTTQVAAQVTDAPGKCGPHHPHGKPTDPATPTGDGTPAPRPSGESSVYLNSGQGGRGGGNGGGGN